MRSGKTLQRQEKDAANAAAANKGAPMKVTNRMAAAFARLVKEEKRSPFDAVQIMRALFPKMPCARTWYCHIAHGDLPVKYGAPQCQGRLDEGVASLRPRLARPRHWEL